MKKLKSIQMILLFQQPKLKAMTEEIQRLHQRIDGIVIQPVDYSLAIVFSVLAICATVIICYRYYMNHAYKNKPNTP